MAMPPDLYELYAEFGIAAETAQVLEVEAGNAALNYLAMFVDTDRITPEETELFRGVTNDLNRKTLGAMLKHIKAVGNFDDTLLQIVDEALERRNYLTHKFFRAHNFAIQSPEGRKAMIAELKSIQSSLQRGLGVLSAVTDSLTHFSGRTDKTKEIVDALAARGKRIDI
jgi:hypothetical protein